jgi:IS30 family transposase
MLRRSIHTLTPQKETDNIANKINAAPVKCLGFKIPAEILVICGGVVPAG